MALVLREMHAGDLERVTEILAFWNMAPVAPSEALPDTELAAIPVATTLVAVVDGTIDGAGSYVLMADARAQTEILAIDPRSRGTGLGTRLQLARLRRMQALGVATVCTDADRPETIDWYVRHFGYRTVGTRAKKHPFGLETVDHWTLLELDLRSWTPPPRRWLPLR